MALFFYFFLFVFVQNIFANLSLHPLWLCHCHSKHTNTLLTTTNANMTLKKKKNLRIPTILLQRRGGDQEDEAQIIIQTEGETNGGTHPAPSGTDAVEQGKQHLGESMGSHEGATSADSSGILPSVDTIVAASQHEEEVSKIVNLLLNYPTKETFHFFPRSLIKSLCIKNSICMQACSKNPSLR